jgi:hypothetical protein
MTPVIIFAHPFGKCWQPSRILPLSFPPIVIFVLTLYIFNLPILMAWSLLPLTLLVPETKKILKLFGKTIKETTQDADGGMDMTNVADQAANLKDLAGGGGGGSS